MAGFYITTYNSINSRYFFSKIENNKIFWSKSILDSKTFPSFKEMCDFIRKNMPGKKPILNTKMDLSHTNIYFVLVH